MSSARHVRRSVLVTLLALAFIVLAVVFPRVYDVRYSPEARLSASGVSSDPSTPATAEPGSGATAAPAPPDDASWHPVPTAEQDARYARETGTGARPGAVVAGRDGYLFLGDVFDRNFAQAMGRRYYTRAEAVTTVGTVQAQNTWLARRGILGEYVVVPSIWSVYPDKMPEWTDGQVLPRILDQLTTVSPSTFVDLRAPLREGRRVAETYSRLNSHWSDYGALVGFAALASRIEVDAPSLGPLRVPTAVSVTTRDSDNEFAAISGAKGPNNWTVPTLDHPLPEYTVIRSDGSRVRVGGDYHVDMLLMPLQTENPNAGSQRRALILADSATASIAPYLVNAFASTLMVRHHADDPADNAPNLPALVESFHPDVVISLVSERELNTVPPDAEVWQAALAYDNARPEPVAEWTRLAGGALSVTGTDISSGLTLAPRDAPASGTVARLEVTAAKAGTLTVSGVGSSGAFTRSIRLTQGANVVFAVVPAGLDSGGLRVSATSAGDVTAATLRALP